MKNTFRFSLLFFFSLSALQAQILDDSSRQVYSTRTVFIRQENEMSADRGKISPDTLLNGFSDKLDFLYKDGKDFQNLGTFASASRPLLYELPVSIGRRNGMHAFDALVPERDKVNYFNTLSPFTSLRYMQGARKRSMLQATFAVNPMARFNISGHYQRLTALRALNISSQDERETDHHSAWLSSHYRNKSGSWRIWGHYRHLNHLHYLTGGARKGGPGFEDSLFNSPEIMRVRLFPDAHNRDLRNAWYLSQVWRNKAGYYLRSSHSREKQVTRYGDSRPDSLYYGKQNFFYQAEGSAAGAPDSLFIQRVFEVWENTLAAGRQDSLSDLQVYLKRRDWNLQKAFFPGSKNGVELILGVSYSRDWQGKMLALRSEVISAQEYDLKGNFSWKGFQLSGRLFSFLPSLVQENFQSKNLAYDRNFESSKALQIKLEKKLNWKTISLTPRFEAINLQKGIAFDSGFSPFQSAGLTEIRYLGLDLQTSFWKRLHSSTRFTRTIQSGTRISGMPGYVLNSSHWFDLVKNRKAYAVQLGFSLDWRTAWPSEVFHGPNAQWYLQQSSEIPEYLMVNSFVHLRIDRVRVYFKVHNTLQGAGSPGYFAAPFYPGQGRLFELGLDWTFFD